MKISKNVLIECLKKCLPGVETGMSIIEGADTFVFENNAVHSYNDSVSVTVPMAIDADMCGSVKSAEFFRLISKLKTDEIEITPGSESWAISGGKLKAEITLIHGNLSGYLKSLNIGGISWKKIPANMIEGFKLCRIPANRSLHRGIFCHDRMLLSTDLQRINYFDLVEDMGTWWVDDPAIQELLKFPSIDEWALSAAWIHFRTIDGTVFSAKRKEDQIFPYQKILEARKLYEKDVNCISGTLPKDLADAVDRVSTLSRDVSGFEVIRLTFHRDEIEAYSERISGRVSESTPLAIPFPKEINITIWVDSIFVEEAVKKVPDFYIKGIPTGDGKMRSDFVFSNSYYTQIVSTVAE